MKAASTIKKLLERANRDCELFLETMLRVSSFQLHGFGAAPDFQASR